MHKGLHEVKGTFGPYDLKVPMGLDQRSRGPSGSVTTTMDLPNGHCNDPKGVMYDHEVHGHASTNMNTHDLWS